MHDYGLTERQLGALAVSHRQHALLNGRSQLRDSLTLEQYLNSRMIADPFRAADCCLITDGAGAFVMTAMDRARDCSKRPVRVPGTGFASAPVTGDSVFTQGSCLTAMPGAAEAARRAFASARIDPKDVDFAEIYDSFSTSCLLQLEDIGLCRKGEAAPFIEEGGIAPGGALPVNTHGGFLAHSYRLGIEHVTASPTTRSRTGSGRSATATGRRSCSTSTMSLTASTCAATCAQRARYCVVAAGNLSTPRVPDFKGIHDFRSKWYTSICSRMRASILPGLGSAPPAPARRACR
jgi:hypothetical protein